MLSGGMNVATILRTSLVIVSTLTSVGEYGEVVKAMETQSHQGGDDIWAITVH